MSDTPTSNHWMIWQAAGDIGSRQQVTVDGVKATWKFGSVSISPGDSHGRVRHLPTLPDDIAATEPAGAILFIPISMTHRLSDANGTTTETTHFGGWMDHSFFFMINEARNVERAGASPESLETETYVMGDYYATRPTSGGAWWWGAMTGVDHDKDSGRYGRTIVGKSYLHIEDFSDPGSLNVAMINMLDTTEGQAYPDITWEDVTVNSNGSFHDRGLRGAFYGPDSEDAAGMFTKDGIAGAFGASRAIGAAPDE
ncbi:MAG: transferrin-binding protein-like solute binding protein [Boseongicola sp. SB0662_bin_57]|nr:transferrin-binding protein-like solute binding protein [Boseongicola sp. SB0662_bin_57]